MQKIHSHYPQQMQSSNPELSKIKHNRKNRVMKKLIIMGACSALFIIANQIAVTHELIDPFMYFLALIGGGGMLVLSIGEIFVMKAEQRLDEIEKENKNVYTPKL